MLVPLGMSPIQVAEPPASIADALPVLNSASDRLRRLEPVLSGQLKAEGRELIRMVAEHILTCLRSHDPAISLMPVIDGPVAEMEAAARDSVRGPSESLTSDRSELSTGATWNEPNPSGGATGFDS